MKALRDGWLQFDKKKWQGYNVFGAQKYAVHTGVFFRIIVAKSIHSDIGLDPSSLPSLPSRSPFTWETEVASRTDDHASQEEYNRSVTL